MSLSPQLEKEVERIFDEWDATSAVYLVPIDALRDAMRAALKAAEAECKKELERLRKEYVLGNGRMEAMFVALDCAAAIRRLGGEK